MQPKDVENVLIYLGFLENNISCINNELEELKSRYNPLKGVAMDGMPGSSMPGDSTGMLAMKLADDIKSKNRERELLSLKADRIAIKMALNSIKRDYRLILEARFVFRISWNAVAREIGCSVITAQRWEKKALVDFGCALDELPDAAAIRKRSEIR